MLEHLSPGTVLLTLILATTLAVAYGAWQNRPRKGSKTVTVYMLIIAALVGARLLDVTVWSSLFFLKIYQGGLAFIAFAIFAFALAYTEREQYLTPGWLAVIFALPMVVMVVLWTPTVTGAFATPIGADIAWDFLASRGPLFWGMVIVSYTITAVTAGLLLHYFLQVHELFRATGVVVLGGIAMLWLFSVLDLVDLLAGLGDVPWIEFGYLLTGTAFFWAVYRGGLTELTPIARSTITQRISAGIVVIDDSGAVTDVNPEAREYLGIDEMTTLVGQSIDDLLEPHPELQQHVRGFLDDGDPEHSAAVEFELITNGASRIVLLDGEPLFDRRDVRRGTALFLYDVTEIKRREEELELLNRILRHDIQNDLMVIRGYTDLLGSKLDAELEAVEADVDVDHDTLLAPVIERSDHAVELTESVRDLLESITAGDSLELEARPVVDVLESELEKARSTYPEADFSFEGADGASTTELEAAFVAAHPMLTSVFANLFTNAIRHNDTDSPAIDVSLRMDETTVTVAIADNGPGVPDEQKETIFGRGERGLQSPGTGIGLYLVDTLIEQFGGTVHVRDNEPRGAIFEVSLRRVEAPT